jgi:beta-galactosidase
MPAWPHNLRRNIKGTALPHHSISRTIVVLALLGSLASCAAAQRVVIDATATAPAPEPVATHLGSNRAPDGDTIGVNSEYLTLNGKPWLPVMGEFHYSRYPAARWEEELLKMKSAGVQIVSTYVIWIHHEQVRGHFDWTGQRDLHRFAELCRKHGMYLYPRIGPWAHAETRNGGLPDWVAAMGATRQNDPQYLAAVDAFYKQIAAQLHGEMWKDGGPVIGVQLENEYSATGPGKGADHIRALKAMAVRDGFDVPLYTVTGWDGAAIPLDEVLPVFGGYPDAPWDGGMTKLPPSEVYAFRFDNRAAGSMGAIGGGGQNAAASYRGTPFLTAEIGDGIEDTYFRRPVLTTDDIAAIPTVMLGSGVNLLGYYMFHGGRNPDSEVRGISLQESQRSGYPTDVPERSYDFQAPIGEFGQERPSLRKLKLVHYFLEDFGSSLAPMVPRRPSVLPASPGDLSVPRVSARTLGDSGYLFVNNHVRGVAAPERKDFQVELKLPSATLQVPAEPIDLPTDAYGIWPVNLRTGSQLLRYSTAQLFMRLTRAGHAEYFFFAIDGVPAEFAFDGADAVKSSHGFRSPQERATTLLRWDGGGGGDITLQDGTRIFLLREADADQVWRSDADNSLLATAADVWVDRGVWTLTSAGSNHFAYGLRNDALQNDALRNDGKLNDALPNAETEAAAADRAPSLFRRYAQTVSVQRLELKATQTRFAGARAPFAFGPKLSWRPAAIALVPQQEDFSRAAQWQLAIPALQGMSSLDDVRLRVRYMGDVAHLDDQDRLLDDNFWNGEPWEIGLEEVLPTKLPVRLTLQVLPLPPNAPLHIDALTPQQRAAGLPAQLKSAELVPVYRLDVPATPQK